MKLNVKSSENRETIRSKRQSKGATFLSKLLICKGGAHASLSGSQMEVKKCCELRNPLDNDWMKLPPKLAISMKGLSNRRTWQGTRTSGILLRP